jgi:predicted SprT family Zn-dependent metalloprotease
MELSAVQDQPEKSGTVYRCPYCKRVYEKVIQAKECARTCKDDIQKKIDAEARYKKTQTVEDKMKMLAAFAGGEHNLPPIKAPSPRRAEPANRKSPAPQAAAKAKAPAKPQRPTTPEAEQPSLEMPVEPPPQAVHPAEGTKFQKDGNSYRCHSCHQKYKKYQEAIACYDLHREQEKAGVASKKDGDDKFFRDGAKYVCRKCNKKFFSRNEVASCFDAHQPEEDIWVTGAEPEPAAKDAAPATPAPKETLEQARTRRATARSENEKFFRNGAKYVCRVCNKKLFTKSEVIQCYDSHADEEEAGSGPTLTTQDIEAAAVDKAPPTARTGSHREGEDKFYRDGAKYVCKKCNGRHFTRNEVIQCFDKH